MSWFALRTARVQSWISHSVAGYLSEQLGAKVEIGGVYIDLWARLEIQSLYIEDQHQDTLLFVPNLFIKDYHFDQATGHVDVASATLEHPYFNIIRHQGDTSLNYAFILRYIDSMSSPDDTSHTLLNFANLEIVGGYLNYNNENREVRTRFGIDWNHLQADDLNIALSDFAVVGDSIHAGIESLSLNEKSGFQLKKLSSDFTMTPGHVQMKESLIETNRSEIQGDLAFQFESIDDFDFFEERVKMNHHLRDTRLYLGDLAYFSSDLVGWDKEVFLSGKFKGRVSSLKGKEVKIQLDENTRFAGSFSMDGLPEIDQTFIIMEIDELTSNKTELDRIQIPPFDSLNFLKTPDNFASLGQITYSGNFTGFINDFASIGRIKTAIGDVETDIALHYDDLLKDYVYRGDLATTDFDLGKFYNSPNLGTLSCRLFVDGSSLELKKMNAGFHGEIQHVFLNGYDYSNIVVKDGRFALRQFKGDFSIDDPNASVDFNGTVDFRPQDPLLNFTAWVDHLNLKALNILPQYDYSSISGKVQITSEGFEFEKFVGEIILDDVVYCASNADYQIGNLVLTSERKGEPSIRMRSGDLADIDIHGDFDANELVPSLTSIVAQIVPSLQPPIRKHTAQNFQLEMKVYDISQITEVFIPELDISPFTKLELTVDETQNTFDLFINSGSVNYDGNEFKGAIVKADRYENDPTIYMNIGLQKFESVAQDILFEKVFLDLQTKADSVYTNLVWGDSLTAHRGVVDGKLTVRAFDAYDFIFYDSCRVSARNETWRIKPGTFMSMDQRELQVRNLELTNGDQWIKADGGISEDPRIPLNFEIHEFNLGTVNAFTGSETKFYGTMGGVASVRDVYNNLIFSNDITLRDFMLNDYYVGYLCVETDWDNIKRSLRVDGTLEKDLQTANQLLKLTPLKFSGYYNPDNEKSPLDIVATVNDLDLAFINEFLSPGIIDIKGYTSGTIAITGQLESPQMEGEAFLRDASIYVNYLNARYNLKKQIGIYPDMFTFDYLPISDQENNPGHLTGQIMHKNFGDWNFDLVIDLDHPMLAMNTNEELNPMYYGKAYATGVVNIYGYEDQLEFDCNLKTAQGTKLTMPMGNAEEQSFGNFVHFIEDENAAGLRQNDLSGIKLNFNMEITPDAEFQIVFDEGAGDAMRGRGKGHILMDISGLSTFNMYGLVEVVEGDYFFTLQNLLVNKRFFIKPGGTIAWYGDPFMADLDLQTIYNVSASLYDIVPDPRYAGGQRVPVDLVMNLTGKMMNPAIEFDVQLPNVDQVTRSRVNSVISTEQERNRQAFSLLVLRRFVSPPNVSSDHQSTNVISATSSELLSSQVSNWLSQLSTDFDLGFNYRPGDDISNEEIALALSTQLFNDRLSLSTNLGVSRNTSSVNQNTNNLIGDIRIEYRIDDNGKVKMVVYNESSDFRMATTQQSPYTQGLGILYQEEFDTLDEFWDGFRRMLKGDSTKVETPVP